VETVVKLYRAHSLKYLQAQSGVLINKNLTRTRIPRDSDPKLHRIAGEWFTKKFGSDYRSLSLFCSGDVEIAKGYLTEGKGLVQLSPVGDFRLCFSPSCKDLFGHFQFKQKLLADEASVFAELESLDFVEFKNHGLEASVASKNEVMVIASAFHYKRIA
jgi:hypothetical protein